MSVRRLMRRSCGKWHDRKTKRHLGIPNLIKSRLTFASILPFWSGSPHRAVGDGGGSTWRNLIKSFCSEASWLQMTLASMLAVDLKLFKQLIKGKKNLSKGWLKVNWLQIAINLPCVPNWKVIPLRWRGSANCRREPLPDSSLFGLFCIYPYRIPLLKPNQAISNYVRVKSK